MEHVPKGVEVRYHVGDRDYATVDEAIFALEQVAKVAKVKEMLNAYSPGTITITDAASYICNNFNQLSQVMIPITNVDVFKLKYLPPYVIPHLQKLGKERGASVQDMICNILSSYCQDHNI